MARVFFYWLKGIKCQLNFYRAATAIVWPRASNDTVFIG